VSRRANPVAIGAFVLGAIALVVIGLIAFGGVNFFNRPLKVVMFFDESVNGLSVGAPIAYRGVNLGTVTDIKTQVGTSRIAVFANINASALTGRKREDQDPRRAVQEWIARGLRAQLGMQSFVTGQLFVSLVILPDTPVVTVGLEPSRIEIPTVPTLLRQLADRLEKIADAIQDQPWDQLFASTLKAVQGAGELAQSPELKRALRSADAAMSDLRKFTARLDRDLGPLIASLRQTSDGARRAVADVGPLIASLRETSETAQSAMADLRQDLHGFLTEAGPLVSSLRETSDVTRGTVQDVGGDLRKALADLQPLIAKLESTADAARATLETTQGALGGAGSAFSPDSSLGYQLAQTLREVTAAARSLRALTDYFEQHPDAIFFGKRKPEKR
jgi:paraquat-inducible protein B